jgi:high-affinity K+ transport system ATPase subunit B
MDLTRNALLLEEVGDDLLGVVGGTRVADDPVVDVLVDRVQTFMNDVRLVLHDHA